MCLVAALFLGQRAAAESPFVVDAWTLADGLRQSSVIALTQTRDGYLWLGTLNGLLRFDGNSFTTFNVNNTPGLPGNGVVFLFEDSRTNLWVGTDNAGLCVIKNGAVQSFDGGSRAGKIVFAKEDEAGVIWFCTADGKFISFKDGKLDLQPKTFPAHLFYQRFFMRLPGKDGTVWQLQNRRVEKIRDGKVDKDFGASPWPDATILAQFKSPDGSFFQLWFDNNITAACEDGDGGFVVGTHGAGVYWFDKNGGTRHISMEEGLSKNFVLSLCFDHEGNLWVGTDGGGLDRVKKSYFETPAGLSVGIAQSASEDAQGGLWVQDNSRGVVYYRTNSSEHYDFGAWAVLVDSQQQVWAGTRGQGLFRFVSGNFKKVSEADKAGMQIFALFQSRDGKLWVGGDKGLGCLNGGGWTFFTAADGLPSSSVRALAEDAKGNLWIGTEGAGLFTLHDGKISSAQAPVTDIACLLVDQDDVLWVGTSGHGLARLAQGHWTDCAAHDGLAGDDIGYLIEDDLGYLWAGSYEGLMRIGKKSVAEFAADPARKISCRTLLARECSAGAQPAAIRTRDGKLWFPTTDGLISVAPSGLKPDTNPPPVLIESVLVDDALQQNDPLRSSRPEAVTLTPENEQLEIHFTALNFSAPKHAQQAVRFKYQLEGHDKKPTDAGGERVAHFSKLTPGNYVFRVTACNEDGYWNETGATLAVTVEPPFWQRPGFIVVSVLILLGGLAGTIYLISTAKLKRQLRVLHQKELIERERARIARDLHDQLGANLTQVTLLGEMAEADKNLPEEVEQHAQQICATARETTHALDEIVWAVNPSNDTLEGLANYACKYAQDYFALAGVSYRAELPPNLPPTPILPEVRHNVFLAFKEAVNNVVKHAGATEARVKLQLEPTQFILSITDNGRGLGDMSGKSLRNGMKNMRKRLADVRGEFEIAPGTDGGTVVQLKVPIAQK